MRTPLDLLSSIGSENANDSSRNKSDIVIVDDDDDDNDRGSGGTGIATNNDSSDRSSASQSAASGNGNVRETGDGHSRTEISDPELRGAIGPELPTGSPRGRGNSASGRGNSRGNAGRSSASGRRSAEKDPTLGLEFVPRKVADDELTSVADLSKSKSSLLSGEIWAEGIQLLFEGAAVALKDGDWRIDDEDAAELGDRAAKFLSKLDAKSLKKWEKKADKILPGLSLAMGLSTVIIPRVRGTLNKKKNGPVKPTETASVGSGGSNGTTAPAQNHAAKAAPPIGATERSNGNRPVLVTERPIRREDWSEIFTSDAE